MHLCREGLANLSVERWANFVKHVCEVVESNFWIGDSLLQDMVEQVVIGLNS